MGKSQYEDFGLCAYVGCTKKTTYLVEAVDETKNICPACDEHKDELTSNTLQGINLKIN